MFEAAGWGGVDSGENRAMTTVTAGGGGIHVVTLSKASPSLIPPSHPRDSEGILAASGLARLKNNGGGLRVLLARR